MPKYKVRLYQVRNRFADIEVEAKDMFEAEEIALEKEQTGITNWGVDFIEDGGVDGVEELREYSHVLDFSFTVQNRNPEGVTDEEFREGLMKRIKVLDMLGAWNEANQDGPSDTAVL